MRGSDPVNRLMTEPVVAIDVNAPAGEILRLFAAHPFHHLPVVDGAKVVGMLSSADVLKLEAFLPRHGAASADFLDQRLRIEQLMRRPPITVSGTQSVEQAMSLMTRYGIHALPVTDSHDKLLGIITTTDIIAAVLDADRHAGPHGAGTTGAQTTAALPAVSAAQASEAAELAVAAAERGDDSGKMARALLHAQTRLRLLEQVLASADRYVHGGQDQGLHRALVSAIARAKAGAAGTLRQRL